MIKIIDRYLIMRFLKLLFITIISCQAMFVFFDFIGSLDRYLNSSMRYAVLYYYYLLPYITVVMFPVAMLMAAMFTTGVLAMHNEINAVRAAGIGIARTVAPLFIVSIFICVGVMAVSETILPRFHRKKTETLSLLQNSSPSSKIIKRNHYYQGKNGFMYRFREFNGTRNAGLGVLVEKYEKRRLVYRVSADSMVWRDNAWYAHGGVKMQADSSGVKMTNLAVLPLVGIQEKPDDFLVVKKTPDDMNFLELREYIDQVRRSGGKAARYMADLHFKISYPLINLIVVILGVSLTVKVGKRGLARVFGVGLATCFIYYVFAKLGLAFGHSGELQPFIAAWLGNIVFFILSLILFIRVIRY